MYPHVSDCCPHQQNSEVLQHTVHHVFLRQVFELVDEVDHVFTHRRAADSVDEAAVFKPRILRLKEGETEISSHLSLSMREDLSETFWPPECTAAQHERVLTSTFSTTCLPKEQTLVEQVMVMFSELSYWLVTP